MGIHQYPCPTCWAPQRVKAASGEVVEIQDCAACAQAKRTNPFELEQESIDTEVNAALDRYAKKRRG